MGETESSVVWTEDAVAAKLRLAWHDELDAARARGDRDAVVRISRALKMLPGAIPRRVSREN